MRNMSLVRASLLGSATLITATTAIAQTPLSDSSAGRAQANGPAPAPQGAADRVSSEGGLEDIIVTARRTAERLQTTPVAVTALTASAITQAQITDAVSIQRSVPGLMVSTGSAGGAGITGVSIRGASTVNLGTANDPAVATYVDGVYIPRPSQGTVDLVDLQRVEVLRGPQGTLFGRNTTGGALNIITANPVDKFEGQVRVQIGNYNYRNIGMILNAPITSDLFARIAYDFTDRDGFARDINTGRQLNDRNSHFVRAKLRWAPAGSDWSMTLSGDYNRLKDHGQFARLAGALPGPPSLQGLKAILPNGIGALPGIIDFPVDLTQFLGSKNSFYRGYSQPTSIAPPPLHKNRATTDPLDYLEAYGGSLTIEGRLGEMAVKSITAYRYSFALSQADLDATPVEILSSQSYFKSYQISEELQLSGDLSDRFHYIFGGFYSYESGAENGLVRSFAYSPVLAAAPNRGFAINYADVESRSLGIFGQANYDITSRLRFTGGLRWTFDTRKVKLQNRTSLNPEVCSAELIVLGASVTNCSFLREADFDYPAWTASLDYKATDELFLYGKTSGASKAGTFNLRNGSANTPPVNPEHVRDVEAGVKFNTRDNRLRVNLAGFYSWQSGVQRNASGLVIVGGAPLTTQFLQNAGKQHIYGGEFEASAVPWTGMTINGNLALLFGGYVRGSFTEVRDLPGAGLPGCTPTPGNPQASRCIVDRSGEPVPQKPRVQYNISATQVIPTGLGELSLHANYAYVGHQQYDAITADPRESAQVQANAIRQSQLGRQPGYGLLDARVALQVEETNLELFMFAKNITNKKYTTRTLNSLYSSLGIAIQYVGNPFTFGGGATLRF